MRGEMKIKRFRNEKQAVAGVIEALLLVALVSIVISTIQLVYIPQVMEQREAEHMDQVSNQFSSLKSMIDLQAMTQSDAPIFSMITLGSRELPYFITAKAFGEVTIQDTEEWNISIDDAEPGQQYFYKLTSIKYEAYNSYFVDQTYVLEGGGIIVRQPNGEPVMRVDPSITVENESTITIDFDLPIIVGIPGKNVTYDYGKCFIRTNWSIGGTDTILSGVESINISTEYPNAWNQSLYNMLGDNVNYSKGENYVEITKKSKDIGINIEYYYVTVQIGPGWID
jgi:hypothetical protein